MKSIVHPLIITSVVIILAALLSSCANTKLTSVWMDNSAAGKSYKDLLIIGIAKEEHNRRLFEQTFASELGNLGVESAVSYELLPAGTEINKETVSKAIAGKEIDAVIVTHMVGVEEKTIYRQNLDYRPTYGYYNGLYNYYPHVHTYVNQPGYYTTHEIVTLETNLYDVASENLVWSARSETFAPESADEVVNDLIDLVIKDLSDKKLIQKKQPV